MMDMKKHNAQIHPYAGNGDHTASYYAASANTQTLRPKLMGDVKTDICVVGAGFSGLSTALHLAEKGYKVTILEGARIGWGASGRNGGQIVNGLNASLEMIGKRHGADTATFIASLLQEGGNIIRDRVKSYNIKCDLKPNNIFTGYTAKHMHELEARAKLWETLGITGFEMLGKNELRNHINSDVYAGGIIDYMGGHIHPLNLALGEADAVEKNGSVIFEMSPVTNIKQDNGNNIVQTPDGSISCKTVILCGNAYLGRVMPQLTNRIMPVSTQILATEPLGDVASSILPTDICVEDIRYILDYFRLSADGRLLFGGGTNYGGTDPKNLETKLRKNMHKVFPQLGDVKIDYVWSGIFALSFTRIPQMGRLDDNIYFAHGYSGHGVTGTHTFGRILAEAIDGDLSRFDVFANLPWIPFPGGRSLSVPYSAIGSWWYALRDRLGV